MKIPISWLKDYIDIDLPITDLAHRLTLAGLEVEEIRFVGLSLPEEVGQDAQTYITGLAWDPEKIVVGEIREVMPHPNADRLVLCRLHDGKQEHTVLTGAPNLFELKGKGPLDEPLKVAFALEGARIYDGHKQGFQPFTLKRAKIRGVESYSMACSEKELGISEDHEGVIILDADAPVGMPLASYMGDAVLDITLTPNIARDANILGVAREVAALTGKELRQPDYEVAWTGPSLEGRVGLEIQNPELNPRFVLGLVEGVEVGESPYWVQRRLHLAGMRPINNIVDATNYVMLEVGEPLHAFDYDVLVERAGGEAPKIITRLPSKGETLKTLDDVDRKLDDFTVLVSDTAGALSIAGVMGGEESEVSTQTTRVLLEGAAWNFINIRRTTASQNLSTEASWRFERGVHPAQAERGVRRGLNVIQELAGGSIAEGLVDKYPLPPEQVSVEVSEQDVERWLGVHIPIEKVATTLRDLEFEVEVEGQSLRASPPDHRLDIGSGIIGKADLMEEVARIYGYDRIPETMIADEIPPLYGNAELEKEERLRDLLVSLGLQEVVTYRLTTPEAEGRLLPAGEQLPETAYIRLENPISSDRVVMRRTVLPGVLAVVERNVRFRDRVAIFEIGPIYLPVEGEQLPEEPKRLCVALTGPRALRTWQAADRAPMDFFDLKGFIETLLDGMGVADVRFEKADSPSYHPGKSAQLIIAGEPAGVLGELHPLVKERFDLLETPMLVAEVDVDRLLGALPDEIQVENVKTYPPVFEDLAIVVDETVTAERVEQVIWVAGGEMLEEVQLFDLYRGEQIGVGKKSLAYALTYQAADRTLTDEEAAGVRARIVKALESELGAGLRS
ncbi:MAG: phenylalanine--tRNA ligase subunit beta [Anaerolineales bacterium]|jgi:phenylalanyl-tRNA synthetase beta chain